MKLTDYIASFLIEKGVECAFGMSGGAAVHLFDSIYKSESIKMISMTHEQCAAIAADGYARATGKLGVAITTSGPGATNLLTGTCCSFYDSIPTLMLTGQVATHRLKGDRNVRQVGFQETDVVSIFKPITKYAVQISDPNTIRFHLEKAYSIAFSGRPGPVLIDIPDDLQRAEIDIEKIIGYLPSEDNTYEDFINNQIENLIYDISQSKRPIIILGGGLKTPQINNYKKVLDKLGIPVLLTWAGTDLLEFNHKLRIGTFGVYGSRTGNFAVQNSDLIIALGTRLSQNLTGGILSSFGREAKIVMVDIDTNEISKFNGFGINIDYGIVCPLYEFFQKIDIKINLIDENKYATWKKWIHDCKVKLPNDQLAGQDGNGDNASCLNIYDFIKELSLNIRKDELIYADTGGNLTWTCNAINLRKQQRLFSAWNNTPMGYSLPASIGAAFAKNNESLTCIIGDGGLMVCLAELITVSKNSLPVKIFLINNRSHGIQKQTLETWLSGNFVCVDELSGLAFPNDYAKVASVFGLDYVLINENTDLKEKLTEIYSNIKPLFIDVQIYQDQKLYPVLKFGHPLENQMPFIGEEILSQLMIVKNFNSEDVNTNTKQTKEGW